MVAVAKRAPAQAIPEQDSPTDTALLAAIAAGAEDAFVTFYERHRAQAYHVAHRHLGHHEAAEEVVQEVFLAVWRRAGSFDPARGAAGAWLLTSVRHAAVSRMRGRWAHERRAVPLDTQRLLATTNDPATLAEAGERRALIRAGLATLPAAQREAVLLTYFEGLTGTQLAAQTAVALGTAKRRLQLGRARLRTALATAATGAASGAASGD